MKRVAGIALVLVLGIGAAQAQMFGQGTGAGARGPTEVGVITLAPEDVPYTETLPGRAVAFQTADIRPRVSGVIKEIPYQPGRPVQPGDVLFVIEDDTYRAALQSAEAGVAQAEASVAAAEAALKRARTLVGVGTTQANLEAAQVTLAQAEASRASAQAARQQAQIDVDQTRVKSPIAGRADLAQVSIGALVTANQAAALTTVQRIDPIFVDVQQASTTILRNRDRFRLGTLERGETLDVALTLEDGSVYEGKGRMVSPGASVSTTTGTTQFRFEFDNSERLILPGQFLRVGVTLGSTRALLVPQRATSRAADGTLTTFVARGGKAVQVTLTEAGAARNAWVVTGGVEAGDQVIVDGLQNLRDGADVTPVPVVISPDGVVTDAESDGAGGGSDVTSAGGASERQPGAAAGDAGAGERDEPAPGGLGTRSGGAAAGAASGEGPAASGGGQRPPVRGN